MLQRCVSWRQKNTIGKYRAKGSFRSWIREIYTFIFQEKRSILVGDCWTILQNSWSGQLGVLAWYLRRASGKVTFSTTRIFWISRSIWSLGQSREFEAWFPLQFGDESCRLSTCYANSLKSHRVLMDVKIWGI